MIWFFYVQLNASPTCYIGLLIVNQYVISLYQKAFLVLLYACYKKEAMSSSLGILPLQIRQLIHF